MQTLFVAQTSNHQHPFSSLQHSQTEPTRNPQPIHHAKQSGQCLRTQKNQNNRKHQPSLRQRSLGAFPAVSMHSLPQVPLQPHRVVSCSMPFSDMNACMCTHTHTHVSHPSSQMKTSELHQSPSQQPHVQVYFSQGPTIVPWPLGSSPESRPFVSPGSRSHFLA